MWKKFDDYEVEQETLKKVDWDDERKRKAVEELDRLINFRGKGIE